MENVSVTKKIVACVMVLLLGALASISFPGEVYTGDLAEQYVLTDAAGE